MSTCISQQWLRGRHSLGCRECSVSQGATTRATSTSEFWQPAAFGGKLGRGTCNFNEENFICGWGNPITENTDLLVVTRRARFCVIVTLDRKFRNRVLLNCSGKWRIGPPDFVQIRSLQFKLAKHPAIFVCKSQQNGSQFERQPKRKIGGQFHGKGAAAEPLSAAPAPEVSEVDRVRNVNILGAGAGASTILEYCQQSSLLPSAQFWYCPDAASDFVIFPEHDEKQNTTRTFAAEGNKESHTSRDSKGVLFLVLGVGSGTGIGNLSKQVEQARSKGSLVVGIFIQPFLFEGPRRLEQANELIQSLLKCTDMLLVVEQNALLRRDRVTLSEASSLASNAVLLTVRGVVDVLLGRGRIFGGTNSDDSSAKPDVTRRIFQNSGRVWLGSGRGNTCKEAVIMAVAEAPILHHRPFEGKQLIVCTLASNVSPSERELEALEPILHRALGAEIQVIIHFVTNPATEGDHKLATVMVTRSKPEQMSNGQLADKNGTEYALPISLGVNTSSSKQNGVKSLSKTPASSSFTSNESLSSSAATKGSVSFPGVFSNTGPSHPTKEIPTDGTQTSKMNNTKNNSFKTPNRIPSGSTRTRRSPAPATRSPAREDAKYADGNRDSPHASQAAIAGRRSRLAWEAGPNSDVAEAWAQARAEARKPEQGASLDISLPVGVRDESMLGPPTPSESFAFSTGFEVAEDKWIGTKAIPVDPDALPRNGMVNMGLEAMRDIYNAASALMMGREASGDRQQASLSQRAASMLESERSEKRLTPLVEMGFKNGLYKGRCQGGLPEGKGRLSFSDGSFYDGHWRQGRRVGAGAFYYANGDLFQGSWKDDVMHGKGWMYYHNGDRLYANFWKGKADGEGRFYSAQGDVFFGQFRDNWRHGEFLYIEASGVRWSEVWESGILNRRVPADY